MEYIYVDNDITITGTGGTKTESYAVHTRTRIFRDFSLALKTGWNAILFEYEETGTFTGTYEHPTSMTSTGTITPSLGNPSLRWVLYYYLPPPANHTPLTFNTWANGNITSSVGEQYFSFTATENQHYIHFRPDTLDRVNGVIYDSNGFFVTDYIYFSNYNLRCSVNLTSGQTYYIKVWPSNSGNSGTYQIAFNASQTAPPAANLLPRHSF